MCLLFDGTFIVLSPFFCFDRTLLVLSPFLTGHFLTGHFWFFGPFSTGHYLFVSFSDSTNTSCFVSFFDRTLFGRTLLVCLLSGLDGHFLLCLLFYTGHIFISPVCDYLKPSLLVSFFFVPDTFLLFCTGHFALSYNPDVLNSASIFGPPQINKNTLP